jgi:hypothetical protein
MHVAIRRKLGKKNLDESNSFTFFEAACSMCEDRLLLQVLFEPFLIQQLGLGNILLR